MLLSHGDRFTPVSLNHRIFRKAAGTHVGADRYEPGGAFYERHAELPGLATVRDLAFRASPVAQIVVTGEDTVAMINQQAETLFGLSARDIGRLLRDLEVSYRPVELRAYVEQAKVERRPARIQDVKWQRPGTETVWFEIHVNPLVDAENGLLGVSIVFFDVTATRALLDKVVQTNRQLEAAYGELQSTNDELQTINDMLRERSLELDEAKSFQDSLVDSIQSGMVVVDREMKIVLWNRGCEDLWGLRADETLGSRLTALDIGLPLDGVLPLIGNAFVDPDTSGEVVVDAVNRRGRPARVRVTCTPFRSNIGTVGGALLLMEVLG